MGKSLLECRLVRSDHRVRAAWSELLDPRDGKAMRAALVAAVRSDLDEDPDWEESLHRYELSWRWGSSNGWRSFRAAK